MVETTLHAAWKRIVDKVIKAQRSLGITETVEPVEPPSPEFGHLGFPAFPFARQLRRNPNDIANDIAAAIEADPLIEKVTTLKGYVNIFLNQEELAGVVLQQIYERKDAFAAGGLPEGKKWVVEYSAPNTNKPLHLGHIRNNLLGMAVSNIAAYLGHDVVKVNLINDRGIHICKTMLAYQRWGNGRTPQGDGLKGDHFVGHFYVRFDTEFKREYEAWRSESDESLSEDDYFNSHSPLGRETRKILQDWEKGDPETIGLWKTMNQWVLDGFDATYERMGCRFDRVQFESETYKLGRDLVIEGLSAGRFAKRDDGAVVLDLETVGMEGQKVLLRGDGTSVYMTQDIGTAMMRIDDYSPERLVYVVGDEQIYHFKLLFEVLGLLRPGTVPQCHHLAYGMVRLPEGKMKSREGLVVDADDLMDELHKLAKEEVAQRSRDGRAHAEDVDDQELNYRAERIAQAALKFFIFRFTPKKSFEYDPKQSIDFTGQTGPYCLYSYARTRSLLRKAGAEVTYRPELVPLLTHPGEAEIVRQLFAFPVVVARATAGLDPSKIAEFAYGLASGFARLFTDRHGYPIINCPDQDLRQARLMLAGAVGTAVRTALGLLGIEVLEEM